MSDENLLLLGKMRGQINFSKVAYLDDQKLLELQEPGKDGVKQLQESFEVAEAVVIEEKKPVEKVKEADTAENKLFNYET